MPAKLRRALDGMRKMKRGFSLVELVIVVALLGIMASIVIPQFQNHSTQAKGAVAKDSLRILRSSIELYTANHQGIPPGYENDNPSNTPSYTIFYEQLVDSNYIRRMPKNPFNDLQNVKMIGNNETFPGSAVEGYGWIYQPATKTIRINYDGIDEQGLVFFGL